MNDERAPSRSQDWRAQQPRTGPQPGLHRIDTGTAELLRDLDRPHAYLLILNGMESSYVDLDDPTLLDFEYQRWTAAIIDHLLPETDPMSALHLGAAGCTLVRYLIARRPDSRHLAVDIDAALLRLVTDWFGLPGGPGLRIQIGQARAITASLPAATQDLVVRDVFNGPTTPPELTTIGFTTEVQRVLRAAGLYVLNCADFPELVLARREAATVAAVFDHVLLAAEPSMLKGRRRGNVVIAGSRKPLNAAGLARALLAGAVPAQLWLDKRVRDFAAGSDPLRDPV